MPTPKVTVLLSSFNHEHYLRESIDSVLNQSFSDFELIIIDDASSDGSWNIIQSYTDPRIRAIQHKTQIGPVSGACRAINELARGEYIAINHSDDAWEPQKLARQCALLDADPSLGAVFTWVQVIDETGRRLENDWFSQPDKSRWEWLNELFNEENHLAHPSLLIRKTCYTTSGLYHPGLMQTPDVDMWCRLLIDWPIRVIPERLTLHRIFTNRANTSSSARPEVRIRTANEWNYVRRHFRRIKRAEDVYRIFPDLAATVPPQTDANVPFLLALACLYCSKSPNAWHLGFEWLFELMDDPITRSQLASQYNFTYTNLMALTGEFDVYAYMERSKLAADYAALDRSLQEVQQENRRIWADLQASQQETARLWSELQESQTQTTHARQELQQTQNTLSRTQEEHRQLADQLNRITRTRTFRLLRQAHRALKKLGVVKHG